MTTQEKIPVTVLTGFLGSGKTTLVNHILTANHGHRIAVIENEFGEIAIDNDLVLNADEKIIETTNGCCLCCTARTDLIEILHTLLQRKDRFDRVLIETSGLADPNPIAQTFFVDDEVAGAFELDAIVTMVDALHIGAHLDEIDQGSGHHQVTDQIAGSDRLVINKIDLVDTAAVRSLERRLRRINATAEIMTSSYADVDLNDILGVGAFDLARTMAGDPHWLEENEHFHDPGLSSVGIEVDGGVDRNAFEAWISALVDERGNDLYRLKGILAVAEDARRYVLQGIHAMFELRPSTQWGRDERRTKVVFIGRDLDRSELTRGLHSCLANAPARV